MALSATYSSATQFTVAGDHSNVFVPGRAMRIDCGVDGIKIGYVRKSVYSAPNTTIDLLSNDSDTITSNIATVEVSSLKANSLATGNIPIEVLHLNRGLRKFFLPTWNAAGTLGVTPGFIHVYDGTREKILTIESALTKAISSLTNETWYYIYVTCPADHDLLVTDADISVSTTAPTYNAQYKGWYDGANRCIGFFKSNSSGTMRFFKTDGFYYRFNNGTTKVTCTNTSGVWQTVTLNLPTFADMTLIGEVNCTTTAEVDATTEYYVRDLNYGGSPTGPVARQCRDGSGSSSQQRWLNYAALIAINSSKQFYTFSSSVTITTYWNCNGIYVPRGLVCT